ncbi:MAG: hypothetical protein EB127_28050 [Alphaproteobacteria bacterium]|nr:hypothetical protein [Alphaproteobacteria bacterium]
MTHDELIAYIDDSTNGLKHEHLFEKLLTNTKALRAVVELHKPKKEVTGMGVTFEGVTTSLSTQLLCNCGALYPCSTIEAIEKELQ